MGGKVEMLEGIARFIETKKAFEAQSIQIRDELLMRLFEILDEPTLNDIVLFQNFIQFLIGRIVSSQKSQKGNKTRHAPQTEIQNLPMLNDIEAFEDFIRSEFFNWISVISRKSYANTPTHPLPLPIKKPQENPCGEIRDKFGSFENRVFYPNVDANTKPTNRHLLTSRLVTFCQFYDIQDYNTLLEYLSDNKNFKKFLGENISLKMLAILYCFFDENPSDIGKQIREYILERKKSLYNYEVWNKAISTYKKYKNIGAISGEEQGEQIISLDTPVDDLIGGNELLRRVINVLKSNKIETVGGIVDTINTNMNLIINSGNFGRLSFINLYLFLRSLGEPAKAACEKMEEYIETNPSYPLRTLFHTTLQERKLGYLRVVSSSDGDSVLFSQNQNSATF